MRYAGRYCDRDHPRTCGEKLNALLLAGSLRGSPPHMRGKAVQRSEPESTAGITPAHAGKSAGNNCLLPVQGDHPRTCGEKSDTYSQDVPEPGSPPHMRGKGGVCLAGLHYLRITPAHAGKRLVRYAGRYCDRDHPRTCGEKLNALLLAGSLRGSPPHMRGKGVFECADCCAVGITPAHAGKRG